MNNLNVISMLAGIVAIVCFSVILIELSDRGQEWIHNKINKTNIYLVVGNIIIHILLVQALMIPVMDISGLLFSNIHFSLTLVGIIPIIGWSIYFSKIVQYQKLRYLDNINGLAHLISLKAMKSKTPEDTLMKLINAEKESGRLSLEKIQELVGIISHRTDSVGAYARRMQKTANNEIL